MTTATMPKPRLSDALRVAVRHVAELEDASRQAAERRLRARLLHAWRTGGFDAARAVLDDCGAGGAREEHTR